MFYFSRTFMACAATNPWTWTFLWYQVSHFVFRGQRMSNGVPFVCSRATLHQFFCTMLICNTSNSHFPAYALFILQLTQYAMACSFYRRFTLRVILLHHYTLYWTDITLICDLVTELDHHCSSFRCWAAVTFWLSGKARFHVFSIGMHIFKHFYVCTLSSRGTLLCTFGAYLQI